MTQNLSPNFFPEEEMSDSLCDLQEWFFFVIFLSLVEVSKCRGAVESTTLRRLCTGIVINWGS